MTLLLVVIKRLLNVYSFDFNLRVWPCNCEVPLWWIHISTIGYSSFDSFISCLIDFILFFLAGQVQIHDNNAMVLGTSQKKSPPEGDRGQHSSQEFQHQSPRSSCFPSSHVKRSRSNSSSSSQSSIKSQNERSTSKFGKIGKKYCCFGSF
jgi:hypothetical protein